jgi:hypothetical protein
LEGTRQLAGQNRRDVAGIRDGGADGVISELPDGPADRACRKSQ